MACGDSQWYAVRVRYQNEFRISRIFEDKLSFKTSVPSQKVWKRKAGNRVVVTRPILSTYVFFLANLNLVDWKLFFSAGGVFGVVRNKEGPVPIPVAQLASLEKLAQAPEPVLDVPLSAFTPNSRVQVIGGPLSGALGNFINFGKKTGYFVVCLDLFNRALVTELEADLVQPY